MSVKRKKAPVKAKSKVKTNIKKVKRIKPAKKTKVVAKKAVTKSKIINKKSKSPMSKKISTKSAKKKSPAKKVKVSKVTAKKLAPRKTNVFKFEPLVQEHGLVTEEIIEMEPMMETKPAKSKRKKSSPTMMTPPPSLNLMGVQPYEESPGENYMNEPQREHFRRILNQWKQELMQEVDRTMHHMQDESANLPDPNDRATREEEVSLELRARDRERSRARRERPEDFEEPRQRR